MDEHKNTKEQQEKNIKQNYGSRLNYVFRKSIIMAMLLPLLVIFTEQFIMPHLFNAVEFNYAYLTSISVLLDYLWMAAVTFLVFGLFHWLEWNQAVRVDG